MRMDGAPTDGTNVLIGRDGELCLTVSPWRPTRRWLSADQEAGPLQTAGLQPLCLELPACGTGSHECLLVKPLNVWSPISSWVRQHQAWRVHPRNSNQSSPGWCVSADQALACDKRSPVRFRIRALPGLGARPQVGGVQKVTGRRFSGTLLFLSLSFSLPSPLSENKQNKILRKIKGTAASPELTSVSLSSPASDSPRGRNLPKTLFCSLLASSPLCFLSRLLHCADQSICCQPTAGMLPGGLGGEASPWRPKASGSGGLISGSCSASSPTNPPRCWLSRRSLFALDSPHRTILL